MGDGPDMIGRQPGEYCTQYEHRHGQEASPPLQLQVGPGGGIPNHADMVRPGSYGHAFGGLLTLRLARFAPFDHRRGMRLLPAGVAFKKARIFGERQLCAA